MNSTLSDKVIGTGWSYPFRIDSATGGVMQSSGIDNIKSSMVHILDVVVGEYVGRRAFGSRLMDLAFSLNDQSQDSLFNHYIIEAFEKWESRVSIAGINIDRSNYKAGVVLIMVDFYVFQLHLVDALVYPYYVAA